MKTLRKDGYTVRVITDPHEARKFVAHLKRNKNGNPYALDFETTGLDPEYAQVRLTCISKKENEAFVIDHFECGSFASFADDLAECGPWYVFNAGFEGDWFDYEAREAEPVKLYDVGHMRRSVLGGGPLSLATQCKRDLGIELDKSLQNSGWSNKVLTNKQYFYGGCDAIHTRALGKMWRKEMQPHHWKGFHVINNSWRAVNECQRTGLLIDVAYHKTLIAMWERRRHAAETAFRKYVPVEHLKNIRSKKQISDFLKLILDQDAIDAWPKTAKTAQLKTDRNILRQMSYQLPYPASRALACLMVFNRADKYLSTYGETLITKQHLSTDGRIHGRLNIAQAITGRFSCCAPWTMVQTSTGFEAIADLKVGDMVLTHKGRYRPVTGVERKGREDMIAFDLDNGERITVTPEHKLLTVAGWMKAKDIGVNHAIITSYANGGRLQEWYDATESRQKAQNQTSESKGSDNRRSRAAMLRLDKDQKLLCVEVRRQEPYEGYDRSAASELERSVRGRLRLSDLPAQRQETVYSQNSHGGTARARDAARQHGSASHRRKYEEQRSKQLSSNDRISALETPQHNERVKRVTKVTGRHCIANVEVWNICVADDHSYCAGGVFHKNSSGPNLQNIPRAPYVRRSFIAGTGRRLILADYSGVEIRVLAEMSGDKILLHDAIYDDVHARSAIAIYKLDADDFLERLKNKDPAAKEMRAKAKGFTFQLLYGAGAAALAIVLRCSVAEAEDAIRAWSDRYKKAYDYRRYVFEKMNHSGFIDCKSGRTIYVRRPDRTIPVAANYGIQGSAGDVMYAALARCYERLQNEEIDAWMMVTVHDELLLLADDDEENCQRAKVLLEEAMVQGWLDIFENTNTDNLVDAAIGIDWSDKE